MTTTTTQSRQHYFSTFQLILLALFSVLIVVAKVVLHLPLHLPGHSGVFWMAILVVARGLVPKAGALSLVGLTSGLIATFMGVGNKGPIYTLLSYLSAGIAVDMVSLFLGGVNNVVTAGMAGVAGNVVKVLTKAFLAIVLEIPAGFIALGFAFFIFTNIIFGALGGVLGWLILRALHKAGFFIYLEEKQ